jgi:hypothetical protein
MPDPGPLLLGIVVPFLVAGAVLLLGARLAAVRGKAFPAGSFEGLAVGLGYAAGHTIPAGAPALPPLDSTDWLFWLALAAAAVSLGAAFLPVAGRWLWIPRVALAAAVPHFVLKPLRGSEGLGLLEAIGWPAAILAWCAALDRLAVRRPGVSLPLVMVMVATASAAAFLISHSLILGQHAAELAAALAPVLLFALFSRPASLSGGGILAAGTVLGGLWLAGWAYDLPAASAALLALAPLAAWLAEVGPFRRLAPRSALFLRLAAVALLLAAAVAIAWRASPPM